MCVRHVVEVKRCSNIYRMFEGVIKGGICFRHGAKNKVSSFEGCTNYSKQGGVCRGMEHIAILDESIAFGLSCRSALIKRLQLFPISALPQSIGTNQQDRSRGHQVKTVNIDQTTKQSEAFVASSQRMSDGRETLIDSDCEDYRLTLVDPHYKTEGSVKFTRGNNNREARQQPRA
eukprot:scaffold15591_cov118-Skeletonema_marinoi.AAC.4